jgi:hypothetical protein
MEATTGTAHASSAMRELAVPLAGAAVAAATIAYGLLTVAAGGDLGAPLAPFLSRWDPQVHALAIPAAVALAGAVVLSGRLLSARVGPVRFAATLLGAALVLRLGLAAARGGIDGWWAVYEVPRFESVHEYLPALPALDLGLRFFLDTFAEVGTSLPVHSIGHPPGLLVTMHLLGIDTAPALAALTIGVGALSVPLTYVLARQLIDERSARIATLLYLLAPSAVLYGATSADALYASLAVGAAALLVARRRSTRAVGSVTFAVASFFSYANLAVGAWAALVAARRESLRSAAIVAGACGVALIAFYGLLHLATGFDPLGALEATEAVYREGIASRRPYAFWLFGSPVAFLIALGLPIAWLALRALARGDAGAVALFAVLAIAAVLGFTKAETERIYLFLVPLACLAAATALPERYLTPALAALAVQALASELLLFTVW